MIRKHLLKIALIAALSGGASGAFAAGATLPFGKPQGVLKISYFSFDSYIQVAFNTKVVNGRPALCGVYRVVGPSAMVNYLGDQSIAHLRFRLPGGGVIAAYNFAQLQPDADMTAAQAFCHVAGAETTGGAAAFGFAGPKEFVIAVDPADPFPELYYATVHKAEKF